MKTIPIPPVTAKQIDYIKILCKEQELDVSEECKQVACKELEELNVSNAATLIDYLKAGT